MELFVLIDLGSSLIKILHGTGGADEQPRHLTIDPEVIEIAPQRADRYRNAKGEAVDRIFIGFDGGYYAIGKLAQEFSATANLLKPKSYYAVPRILAAIWGVSQQYDLGRRKLKLFISCLLPPGELRDRQEIEDKLRSALEVVDTPSGKLKASLSYFDCHPEGSGIASFYLLRRPEVKDRRMGVVMMGHRNLSVYILDRGRASKNKSSDLGFTLLTKTIEQETAGYSERAISEYASAYLQAIACNEADPGAKLLPMLQKHGKARDRELADSIAAITTAKTEYWTAIAQWLEIQLATVNDVVIGGGTCWLFAKEFDPFVRSLPLIQSRQDPAHYFNGGLRYSSDTSLPRELRDRFADAYCLWWVNLAKVADLHRDRSVSRSKTRAKT